MAFFGRKRFSCQWLIPLSEIDFEVCFAVVKTTPHVRLSEEVLAASILKFYQDQKLVPLGISISALDSWAAKMALGVKKIVQKFRSIWAQRPKTAKCAKIAALKMRLFDEGISVPKEDGGESRQTSHEDLGAVAVTSSPAAQEELTVPVPVDEGKTESKNGVAKAARPVATPARAAKPLPEFVVQALSKDCLPVVPFATVGEEDAVQEGTTEQTKKNKKKAKGKKAKKDANKNKKELAGPEEEKNLAVSEAQEMHKMDMPGPAVEAPAVLGGQKEAVEATYEAKKFNAARLNFIKDRRAEGCSHKEANELWKGSEVRGSYLANMSFSELKRRRFI